MHWRALKRVGARVAWQRRGIIEASARSLEASSSLSSCRSPLVYEIERASASTLPLLHEAVVDSPRSHGDSRLAYEALLDRCLTLKHPLAERVLWELLKRESSAPHGLVGVLRVLVRHRARSLVEPLVSSLPRDDRYALLLSSASEDPRQALSLFARFLSESGELSVPSGSSRAAPACPPSVARALVSSFALEYPPVSLVQRLTRPGAPLWSLPAEAWEPYLDRLLSPTPPDREALFRALSLLSRLTEGDPSAELRLKLLSKLAYFGLVSRAVPLFQELRSSGPLAWRPTLYRYVVQAASQAGEFEIAEQFLGEYEREYSEVPSDLRALLLEGYSRRGCSERIESFLGALRGGPPTPTLSPSSEAPCAEIPMERYQLLLLKSYATEKRRDSALGVVRWLRAAGIRSPGTLKCVAEALCQLGEFDEAWSVLESSPLSDFPLSESLFRRSLSLGVENERFDFVERLLELLGDQGVDLSLSAQRELLEGCVSLERYDRFLVLYRQFLRDTPDLARDFATQRNLQDAQRFLSP